MVSSVSDGVSPLMSTYGQHTCRSASVYPPCCFFCAAFSVAFGCRKCYYSPCFKESDSWILGTLIFDIGGDRKIAAADPKGQNLLPLWHNARRRRSRGILTRISAAYAILRSLFEGQIKHIKAVSKSQLGVRQKKDKAESELKDKLKKLESKKRFLLLTRTTAVSGRNYEQWASWQREMEDIDSQIYYLRGLVLGKDMQKGDAGNTSEGIRINKDKTIFQVASEYERNTIVQLENTIVARRSSYMKEESRAILLRDKLNVMSIWPLSNLINKNL